MGKLKQPSTREPRNKLLDKHTNLTNITLKLYPLTEEENNERIKETARMLQRFMEENCKRGKAKRRKPFQEKNFKEEIGL